MSGADWRTVQDKVNSIKEIRNGSLFLGCSSATSLLRRAQVILIMFILHITMMILLRLIIP